MRVVETREELEVEGGRDEGAGKEGEWRKGRRNGDERRGGDNEKGVVTIKQWRSTKGKRRGRSSARDMGRTEPFECDGRSRSKAREEGG